MAYLEGLLEGLCEAISDRAASLKSKGTCIGPMLV